LRENKFAAPLTKPASAPEILLLTHLETENGSDGRRSIRRNPRRGWRQADLWHAEDRLKGLTDSLRRQGQIGWIHKNRGALITGAATGIGKEIAVRLAALGGIPVIADLDLKAAEATAAEIKAEGADAFAVAMNVADEAQVERGVANTVAKYGKVDILGGEPLQSG